VHAVVLLLLINAISNRRTKESLNLCDYVPVRVCKKLFHKCCSFFLNCSCITCTVWTTHLLIDFKLFCRIIVSGWSAAAVGCIFRYYYYYCYNTSEVKLHGIESWPVRKENVVALQRAEMRMVRSMCGIKLKDRFPSKELRDRLGIDDIALVLQQNRLRWYGHVL